MQCGWGIRYCLSSLGSAGSKVDTVNCSRYLQLLTGPPKGSPIVNLKNVAMTIFSIFASVLSITFQCYWWVLAGVGVLLLAFFLNYRY